MKNVLNRKKVAKRIRATILNSSDSKVRLTVYKTTNNVYAQLIKKQGGADVTVASESSLSSDFKKASKNGYGSNVEAATIVGKLIASKAKKLGIEEVAFDRSGYRFHGRIKAVADSARENGLSF